MGEAGGVRSTEAREEAIAVILARDGGGSEQGLDVEWQEASL